MSFGWQNSLFVMAAGPLLLLLLLVVVMVFLDHLPNQLGYGVTRLRQLTSFEQRDGFSGGFGFRRIGLSRRQKML